MLTHINLYVVQYQLERWDLPYVWEHIVVVPTKTEAINIAKKYYEKLSKKEFYNTFIRVCKQMCINGNFQLKPTYIIDDEGFRKIKTQKHI